MDYRITRDKQILFKFMNRLKKLLGYDLQYIAVSDFSKPEGVEHGTFYHHIHVAVLPIKKVGVFKGLYKTCVNLRNSMQTDKVKFSWNQAGTNGIKPKHAVLSYFSLRNAGLFKFHEHDKDFHNIKGIAKKVESGYYMMYKDMMTLEKYLTCLYDKRGLFVRGFKLNEFVEGYKETKRLISCNLTNEELRKLNVCCVRHGPLSKDDVIIRIVFPPAPPDMIIQRKTGELYGFDINGGIR